MDPDEPKARRAIVAALGVFHAPEQAELAERAATRCGARERGEPSYFVEAAAANALGKTRVADAYDVLCPCWIRRPGMRRFAGESLPDWAAWVTHAW